MLGTVNGNTLVLLSGGIDSCATMALYRRRSESVFALFVEYGQAAAEQERSAAEEIARHYAVPLTLAQCSGIGSFAAGYIRGRNALLLHLALAAAPFEAGQIAIGLHSGTPYADCGAGFVNEVQRVFDVYTDGKLRVVAPFLDDDKPAVVAFCRDAGVPLAVTYSCERGGSPPCGECLSCLDRKALDVA
jgi:7-cyano-7-deazaguanine synthase